MQDGGWYNAVSIARTVANDERHYRYLRHAIGGRLREMHEDGIVERRSSRVPGVMFEYRLKP
jgi:DNA-binding HxlR family transcriptional regulator